MHPLTQFANSFGRLTDRQCINTSGIFLPSKSGASNGSVKPRRKVRFG
jgi:hypothetical protein